MERLILLTTYFSFIACYTVGCNDSHHQKVKSSLSINSAHESSPKIEAKVKTNKESEYVINDTIKADLGGMQGKAPYFLHLNKVG